MTGPNPDADLDKALGIDELPPAAVTAAHLALVEPLWVTSAYLSGPEFIRRMAQLVADAEQRGAARVLAESAAAGAPVPVCPPHDVDWAAPQPLTCRRCGATLPVF